VKPIVDSNGLVHTSYGHYLNSVHWKDKKSKFYSSGRFFGACAVCVSTKDLEVHHRTYERVGNEPVSDLVCLCRKCHEKFHSKKKTTKTQPSEPLNDGLTKKQRKRKKLDVRNARRKETRESKREKEEQLAPKTIIRKKT
jgi:5-methylcytosine-specific restriction endonuclease McrA